MKNLKRQCIPDSEKMQFLTTIHFLTIDVLHQHCYSFTVSQKQLIKKSIFKFKIKKKNSLELPIPKCNKHVTPDVTKHTKKIREFGSTPLSPAEQAPIYQNLFDLHFSATIAFYWHRKLQKIILLSNKALFFIILIFCLENENLDSRIRISRKNNEMCL